MVIEEENNQLQRSTSGQRTKEVMKALHLSQACSVSPRQRLQSLAIVDDDHRVQVARSFVNLIPKKQLQEAPTAPVRRSRSLPSIPVSVVFDAYGHHVPCDVSADRAKEGGGGNGEGDSEDSVVLVCGSFLSFVQNVGSVEHLASGRCKLKRCFWAFNKVGCRKGWLCMNCHYCPPAPITPEKRTARNKARKLARKIRQASIATQGEVGDGPCAASAPARATKLIAAAPGVMGGGDEEEDEGERRRMMSAPAVSAPLSLYRLASPDSVASSPVRPLNFRLSRLLFSLGEEEEPREDEEEEVEVEEEQKERKGRGDGEERARADDEEVEAAAAAAPAAGGLPMSPFLESCSPHTNALLQIHSDSGGGAVPSCSSSFSRHPPPSLNQVGGTAVECMEGDSALISAARLASSSAKAAAEPEREGNPPRGEMGGGRTFSAGSRVDINIHRERDTERVREGRREKETERLERGEKFGSLTSSSASASSARDPASGSHAHTPPQSTNASSSKKHAHAHSLQGVAGTSKPLHRDRLRETRGILMRQAEAGQEGVRFHPLLCEGEQVDKDSGLDRARGGAVSTETVEKSQAGVPQFHHSFSPPPPAQNPLQHCRAGAAAHQGSGETALCRVFQGNGKQLGGVMQQSREKEKERDTPVPPPPPPLPPTPEAQQQQEALSRAVSAASSAAAAAMALKPGGGWGWLRGGQMLSQPGGRHHSLASATTDAGTETISNMGSIPPGAPFPFYPGTLSHPHFGGSGLPSSGAGTPLRHASACPSLSTPTAPSQAASSNNNQMFPPFSHMSRERDRSAATTSSARSGGHLHLYGGQQQHQFVGPHSAHHLGFLSDSPHSASSFLPPSTTGTPWSTSASGAAAASSSVQSKLFTPQSVSGRLHTVSAVRGEEHYYRLRRFEDSRMRGSRERGSEQMRPRLGLRPSVWGEEKDFQGMVGGSDFPLRSRSALGGCAGGGGAGGIGGRTPEPPPPPPCSSGHPSPPPPPLFVGGGQGGALIGGGGEGGMMSQQQLNPVAEEEDRPVTIGVANFSSSPSSRLKAPLPPCSTPGEGRGGGGEDLTGVRGAELEAATSSSSASATAGKVGGAGTEGVTERERGGVRSSGPPPAGERSEMRSFRGAGRQERDRRGVGGEAPDQSHVAVCVWGGEGMDVGGRIQHPSGGNVPRPFPLPPVSSPPLSHTHSPYSPPPPPRVPYGKAPQFVHAPPTSYHDGPAPVSGCDCRGDRVRPAAGEGWDCRGDQVVPSRAADQSKRKEGEKELRLLLFQEQQEEEDMHVQPAAPHAGGVLLFPEEELKTE